MLKWKPMLLLLSALCMFSCDAQQDEEENADTNAAPSKKYFLDVTQSDTEKMRALKTLVEKGPAGNESASPDVLALTKRDKERLQTNAYTVALVMHYLESDWSKLQLAGMRSVFDRYGISVISTTGAEYRLEKHMLNMRSAIAKKPDAIVSIVVNEEAEGDLYKEVKKAGIHLILLDMLPKGLTHPNDYDCLISSTSRRNGAVAADIMAEHLKGKGTVAILKLSFPHFVTEERAFGFRYRLQKRYPGIKVPVIVTFGSDVVTMVEAELRVKELLALYPDLDGLFAVWMEPAMAAARAAREAGKTPDNFVITTTDLEEEGVREIAKDGYVKGTGAQRPYAQGEAEALATIKAMLGYDLPPYIAVPGVSITKANITEGYREVFRREPDKDIAEVIRKGE